MKKLLTLCCAVLIGSCCAAAFIYANQASLSPQANLIDSALRSNSNEFKQSAQAVSLPDDWVKTSLSSTVQWYRIRIPDSVKQLPLVGVFIPSLEMTPALYLNGRFVGGNEKLSDPLPRYWNRPVYTMLPANSLAADDNYLDIRIAANGQWGRLSAVQIGPHQQLSQAYERLFFMRVTLARFVQFFCLLMAAFLLPLFFMRREAVFAAFSAFALSWFASNFLVTHLQFSVSNRILDWAIYSSAGLLLASYSFFTLRVLNRRWPRWERCLIAIAGVGMVTLYITSHFDIRSFNDLGSKIWIASLVLLAVAPFLIVVRDVWRQFSWPSFALLCAYTIGFVFAVWDWSVISGIGYRHIGLFLHFAAVPILLSYGVILSRSFVNALDQSDLLNADLENRVQRKSAELEQAYQSNAELREEFIIAQERERIMRDMHDGVGGHLVSALNRLQSAEAEPALIAEEVELALTDLRLMIDSSDSIEGDIGAALGLLRNRMQSRIEEAGVTLSWQVFDIPPVQNLGPEKLLHLFRILQESITNTLRHANAATLCVATFSSRLVNGQRCSGIELIDDGVGIAKESPQGRGLKNMAYRAKQAGFILNIDSNTIGASSTIITIGFPTTE